MMRWMDVYELLQCGGAIRRESWSNEEWIVLQGEGLVNQDGELYDICDFELKANDWQEVVPSKIDLNKVSDETFLAFVQTKSLSILQNKTRVLNLRLRTFGEKQNAIPEWVYSEGLKYYITYSYVANKYMVEGTWRLYHPNVVYFSKREVAEKCTQVYKPLMDEVRHIEGIRGILFNNKELTREEIIEFNNVLDSL